MRFFDRWFEPVLFLALLSVIAYCWVGIWR